MLPTYQFQSSPAQVGRALGSYTTSTVALLMVSILARPSRTGARGYIRGQMVLLPVSILARPSRTGARNSAGSTGSPVSVFQSSPAQVGRALSYIERHTDPATGFQSSPAQV